MLFCMMAVGSRELIRPLTGLVLNPAGCHATLHTSRGKARENAGGGASLDADHPSMRQVVLGYMLPVAGYKPDLTWN